MQDDEDNISFNTADFILSRTSKNSLPIIFTRILSKTFSFICK